MKKTKTICTMGPNTSDKGAVVELVKNGMDAACFNFSHGNYEGHQGRLELLKNARKESDIPVVTLLDTKGPEIRTSQLKGGEGVMLKEGQTYTLTTREVTGDDTVGYISYSGLNSDVAPGNEVLTDDGLIEMDVTKVKDTDIICMIISGGGLGEKKSVNASNTRIKLPALTDKDKEDIRLSIKYDFGFIAASSVHTTDCIQEIKEMLEEQGSSIRVTVKIRSTGGIENLDVIIETANDTMAAQGDMGVEVPAEKVPHIQKKAIRRCNEVCKIIITATQTPDSMIRNPRPVRTEVMDVASAVYNGTDAVMLSGETVMGRYPIEALKMTVPITQEAESHLDYAGYRRRRVTEQNMKDVSNAVCFISMPTAYDLEAGMIIAPSITGFTTQMLSKWRPGARVTDMSPGIATMRQMQLQQGVVPVQSRRAESTDKLVESSVEEFKNRGFVTVGELAVITAGMVTYARRHEATTQTSTMGVINIE